MFDYSNAEETKFIPVPNGTYNVELINAQETVSKSGNNMFKLEFSITEEPYIGKKLFSQFVYGGPTASEKAIAITGSKIKDMCKAMGIEPKFENVQDLIGKKCSAVTKIRTDEQYGDKAEISYFKPIQPPKTSTKEKLPF
jgi:hypothetical protein